MTSAIRRLLAFALAALLLIPAAATAGGTPPIGDPIEPPANSPFTPVPGSFEREAVRTPDPDGGPPWGIGTLLATSDFVPGQQLVCTVEGRIVNGRLGRLDSAGVFHPYALGAGIGGCGGSGDGARYPSTGDHVGFASDPAGGCVPTVPDPSIPGCDLGNVRTFRSALLGPHVLSVRMTLGGRSRPVPVSRGGAFVVVFRGIDNAFFDAPITIRFRVCGPHARRDLVAFGNGTTRGCIGTIVLPLF